MEVENYNKGIQERLGNVQNRLEFRSKNLDRKEKETEKERAEFLKWCKRLDKAVTKTNYDTLQRLANYYLVDKYKKEKSLNVTTNEFLYKYSSNIFTNKQLINFYKRIGSENPARQAKAYRHRKKIEFFSYADLLTYVDKIKIAGKQFFKCE